MSAFVYDTVRTPFGRFGGALSGVRPDDLAATVLSALVDRTPGLVPHEVVLGNANGAGEDNRNVARMAALLAGDPVTVPGTTVNRVCGSRPNSTPSLVNASSSSNGHDNNSPQRGSPSPDSPSSKGPSNCCKPSGDPPERTYMARSGCAPWAPAGRAHKHRPPPAGLCRAACVTPAPLCRQGAGESSRLVAVFRWREVGCSVGFAGPGSG